MVDAFGASLVYLAATTVAVTVAAAFLPFREAQSVKVASSSSAAA
jgi:hypothetical protein